eukprot:TRINITY_DN23678_c0_g1_i1.p1 TRINITY_DN23678_c0_g1~~TRINITY_DN23678_c0_g1_i1.p1  ORF type:complete len:247 (-),score=66.32 TRINITY_DN23678_c0_g1_i1:145-885(-)
MCIRDRLSPASRRLCTSHLRIAGLQTRRASTAKPDPADAVLLEIAETLQDSPALAGKLSTRMDGSSKAQLAAAWAACKGPRDHVPVPEAWQLRRLGLLTSLPMVGFGFMDNFIMIVAGDLIDTSLCFKFGLTTMFAAAVGNIFSDTLGVFTAAPIESLLRNYANISGPGLSPRQMKLKQVTMWKYGGSAAGIVLGCLIGMFPLMWPESMRLWAGRSEKEALTKQSMAEILDSRHVVTHEELSLIHI